MAAQRPAGEGQCSNAADGRHEAGGDAVGEFLYWQFAALRMIDELDDTGEYRVATDRNDRHGEAAIAIQATADD